MPTDRIALVTVGSLQQSLDVAFLEGWSSALIEIHNAGTIEHTPDASGGWVYRDEQLQHLIQPDPTSDFTIAVVNGPLEQNYYSRRLPANLVILSLHEIADILSVAHLRVEHFVLRAAYAHSIYRVLFRGAIPVSGEATLSHQEVRGCLFDLNVNKADIVKSLDPPAVCVACRARIPSAQTRPHYLPTLDGELRQIRRPLYFRISRWIQHHPVLSLAITVASALLLNVLSNAIYDCLKGSWPCGG